MVKDSFKRHWNSLCSYVVGRLKRWPWRRIGILAGAWVLGTVLIAQVFYPGNRLLPFQNIDGLALGGQEKTAAAHALNEAYKLKKANLYLANSQTLISQPTLEETGLTVDNSERVLRLEYPWYLRIMPFSIFWAGIRQGVVPEPQATDKIDEFITTTLLKACQVAPQDASLEADGASLKVVAAKPGGECNQETIKSEILALRPVLNQEAKVNISAKELPYEVTNEEAKASAQQIMNRVGNGVPLVVNDLTVTIAPQIFYSWLDFTPNVDKVEAAVSAEKAKNYLNEQITPKVAIAAGVVTVTTHDFQEISRSEGSDGRTLNIDATISSLNQYLRGQIESAQAITQVVPVTVNYVRTYSSTDVGLNALLANYARDNSGTFGISFAELSGSRRRANFQGDKKFVTASTYKLFVAYSVLKRVESGQMSWAENQTCFNKMISLSDNPCSEAFLYGIGLKNVTNEIQALGLNNSNFTESGGPFTTANDLVTFLGTLESGSMFSSVSRERLLNAMLDNVYRNGIPAGASGQVADKVGFLNGLLHDAAIVYSPKGTYVLAVMTNGSSWEAIAKPTREIEKIR